MRRKNSFFAITLVLIAVIALIIVVQWQRDIETPSISVPRPEASMPGGSTGSENEPLEIQPDTVQALIASIERPDAYSRKYRVHIFYTGGDGEAEAEVSLFRKGGQYRITHTQNGRTRDTLFSDGNMYWWNDSTSGYKSAALSELDPNTLDMHARLILYEELLEIPVEDILEASSKTLLNEICIFVEYRHSDRYVYRLYVSVEKGLLVAAEVLEDGKIVYSLESESAEIGVPTDDKFVPPET